MEWVTYATFNKVKSFLDRNGAKRYSDSTIATAIRIYELRQWHHENQDNSEKQIGLVKKSRALQKGNLELRKNVADLKEDIESLQNSLVVLQVKNDELQEEVAELEERNEGLDKEVAELEEHNEGLDKEVASIDEKNVDLQDELAALQEDYKELEEEVVELNEKPDEVVVVDAPVKKLVSEFRQNAIHSRIEAERKIEWAKTASWQTVNQFIQDGKASGFPIDLVDKLVAIVTEKRWAQEEKVRDELAKKEQEEQKLIRANRQASKLQGIQEELSGFTQNYVVMMSPSEFEHFVGRLFDALGFRSKVVGGSFDGGIDVKLFLEESLFGIVQCKRYSDRNVSAAEVRNLIGAFAGIEAKHAYLFTTSKFTESAIETAESVYGVELYDFDRISTMVKNLARKLCGRV